MSLNWVFEDTQMKKQAIPHGEISNKSSFFAMTGKAIVEWK